MNWISAPLDLVGSSPALAAFREQIQQAARGDATVLLVGESGTGKGLAARFLHHAGARRERPFVICSLAGLAPSLVESILFGHERGAFTDAHKERRGLFRRAEGGTLVLDDVDLLPLEMQVKLLRALQERVVEPVGAEHPVPIDVRIVATTSRDLLAEVAARRFRQDLYYRLAVITLELPPLRAREEDVLELARHLSRRVAGRLGVAPRPLTAAAEERLRRHAWPGNVRELENAIERVHVLGSEPASDGAGAGGALEGEPVEPGELAFLEEASLGIAGWLAAGALRHGLGVEEVTRAMLERALIEQRGNLSAAARQVGLTRRAFDYRLARGSSPGEEEDGREEAEA